MAKISQKIDLSPVVNEINDNQIDISTEHELTRGNLSAAKTSLETGQSQARSAIEGAVTSEGSSTRAAVNNARDNVKNHITALKPITKVFAGVLTSGQVGHSRADNPVLVSLPESFDISKSEIAVTAVTYSENANFRLGEIAGCQQTAPNQIEVYLSDWSSDSTNFKVSVFIKQWNV